MALSDPGVLGWELAGDPFLDFDDCPEPSGLGRTTGTTFSLVRVPLFVLVCVTMTSSIPFTALGTITSRVRGILSDGRSAMDVYRG